MNIISTKFIKGVVNKQEIINDGIPQIAFIGRSNVGKSTTINKLLNRKKLVKTGRTPGKTREINFFLVSTERNNLYFVDLPGYGYAKLSKIERLSLKKTIIEYLSSNIDNILIVIIIDAKVGITDFDKEMFKFIDKTGKKYILAVNKIDKINQKSLNKLKKEIDLFISEHKKTVCYYSAYKGKNINLLRETIFSEFF